MLEPRKIVINTGPLIAIVAATGSLDILKGLYGRIVVPYEVGQWNGWGRVRSFSVMYQSRINCWRCDSTGKYKDRQLVDSSSWKPDPALPSPEGSLHKTKTWAAVSVYEI